MVSHLRVGFHPPCQPSSAFPSQPSSAFPCNACYPSVPFLQVKPYQVLVLFHLRRGHLLSSTYPFRIHGTFGDGAVASPTTLAARSTRYSTILYPGKKTDFLSAVRLPSFRSLSLSCRAFCYAYNEKETHIGVRNGSTVHRAVPSFTTNSWVRPRLLFIHYALPVPLRVRNS